MDQGCRRCLPNCLYLHWTVALASRQTTPFNLLLTFFHEFCSIWVSILLIVLVILVLKCSRNFIFRVCSVFKMTTKEKSLQQSFNLIFLGQFAVWALFLVRNVELVELVVEWKWLYRFWDNLDNLVCPVKIVDSYIHSFLAIYIFRSEKLTFRLRTSPKEVCLFIYLRASWPIIVSMQQKSRSWCYQMSSTAGCG